LEDVVRSSASKSGVLFLSRDIGKGAVHRAEAHSNKELRGMKEEQEAVSKIITHLEGVSDDFANAVQPEELAESSDIRMRDSKDAIEFLDCFLSGGGKRELVGDLDDDELMGTFLCGDDLVVSLGSGVLTLRVGILDGEERRMSFSSPCPKARLAWARIFKREECKSRPVC
jgi:hypothetical protein